jgi:hypothetical protein
MNNKISPWIERKISNDLRDLVISSTSFLDTQEKLSVRVRALLLGIKSKPTCTMCGSSTKYHAALSKYADFCSIQCSSNNDDVRNKTKSTNFEKFGHSCNLQSTPKQAQKDNAKNAYKKSRESMIKNRGVSNPMMVDSVKEKHKNSMSSEEVQEKRIKTIFNKNKIVPVDFDYDKKSFHQYRRLVYSYTRKYIRRDSSFITEGRSINGLHVDHKISCLYGYSNKINPLLIGSIQNLELIKAISNRSKWTDNSITFGELLCSIEIDSMINHKYNNNLEEGV